MTTIHPTLARGGNNCTDPGVNGDDDEAILDAEWASAAAPSAAIVMATCTNILTGIQNLVNGPSAEPPAIMSISYGECEAFNGSSANAAFNSAYQQGVAEGMSIFVSSGDNDAAVCDDRDTAVAASDGIAVNGWASTPYNVAVGGTDFSDTYSGTNSTYWNASNTATYGSARSYIPEIPWNNSCASQLIATYVTGSSLTYGSTGFCNSAIGVEFRSAQHRRRQRRPQQGLWQAVMAERDPRQSGRRRARSSRRLAVRRQRRLGPLLRLLLRATATTAAMAAAARLAPGTAPAAPRSRRRSWPASRRW